MIRVRAATHVHSQWSYDGRWPLERITKNFARLGYRVLLMTEHDRGFTADRWREYQEACHRASTPRLVVVPGMEYSDASNTVHVLVWGDLPFLGEAQQTRELLQQVRAMGGISVLAHPSRRNAWREIDAECLQYLDGIEVWNRKSDGWTFSRDAKELLARGEFMPFVGLDFHKLRQLFPMSMVLQCPDLKPGSVVDAIRHRRVQGTVFGVDVRHHVGPILGSMSSTAERARQVARRVPFLSSR